MAYLYHIRNKYAKVVGTGVPLSTTAVDNGTPVPANQTEFDIFNSIAHESQLISYDTITQMKIMNN